MEVNAVLLLKEKWEQECAAELEESEKRDNHWDLSKLKSLTNPNGYQFHIPSVLKRWEQNVFGDSHRLCLLFKPVLKMTPQCCFYVNFSFLILQEQIFHAEHLWG